jgi:hypothetical protein
VHVHLHLVHHGALNNEDADPVVEADVEEGVESLFVLLDEACIE